MFLRPYLSLVDYTGAEVSSVLKNGDGAEFRMGLCVRLVLQ